MCHKEKIRQRKGMGREGKRSFCTNGSVGIDNMYWVGIVLSILEEKQGNESGWSRRRIKK